MPQNLHMPTPPELMAQTQARDTVLLCLENELYATYLKTCLQDQDFDFELIAKNHIVTKVSENPKTTLVLQSDTNEQELINVAFRLKRLFQTDLRILFLSLDYALASDVVGICDGFLQFPVAGEDLIAAIEKANTRRNKILLIDDSALVHKTIVGPLQQAGFDVAQAFDGEEGYQMARTQQPNLIICDIEMPKMNGYETCAALKNDPLTAEATLIMSSTLSSAADQRKGFEVGVDAFIGKPVHVEGLIEKVTAMLERFRGARESIVILQSPETSGQDIAAVLKLQGFRTKRVPTIAAFLRAVQRSTCDLVICEFEPSDGTIVDLFNGLNTSDLPSTPEVIILLPDTNEANIRMALNAGAKAAVTTGFGAHDLVAKVEKTLADRRTKDEQAQLQRYVSKASLQVALEKAVWGAGQTAPRADRKTVTVTFIDIMNFTPRCEAYAPDDVVEQVNKLFSLVTRAIIKHGGDIDKFIGDACMAFWIHDQNNNAQKALLDTMLEIKASLRTLNESDPRLQTDPFALRIGAHSGPAILCDLGAAEARIDLTVIGDTVNTAARLEAAAKLYGLQNLLGESIISAHQDHYCTRMIDRVTVKGKSQSLACFELMDRWEAVSDTQKRLAETFNEGFAKYTKADFKAALGCFEAAQEHEAKGLDASLTPSSLFLKRCQKLMAEPPKTWTGIWDWNAQ
jgi:DNA-binding response OmpR family regulator